MRKKTDERKDLHEYDRLYERFTLKDIKAYKPDPSTYIVGTRGFIRKGAGTMLIGPTGFGKSVLVEQMALSIACGQNIFGMIEVHEPRKVLYYHAENDLDTLHVDIPSIIKHEKLDEKLVEKNLIFRKIFGLAGNSFANFLKMDVEAIQPELVIIDHYQAFLDKDINSFESFVQWIQPIQELMDTANFGLLLVCHTPKKRDDEKDIREMVYNQMGSSAQANWARASMEISPVKDKLRHFRLSFSKNPSRLGLREADGGIKRMLYVEHSPTPDEPYWQLSKEQSIIIKTEHEQIIEMKMKQNPKASVGQLADMCGFSKSTISKYLNKLKKNEKAGNTKTKNV